MNQDPTSDINLVPEKKFEEQSTTKKLYLWMVGIGRLIVICTELIAVLVWLSRFRLDYEITTLQENIEEKAATISRSARFEDALTQYQKKTQEINQILDEKIYFTDALKRLQGRIPTGSRLLNLSLRENQIEVEALCTSGLDFAELMAALTSEEGITGIVLNESHFNETNQSYLVDLSLNLSKEFFQ